ncbi:hypothetical protein BC440_19240 [Thalassospira sp. MIT1004]|nr:hypothetical protein BC440_19240 [Thalassospira sp. MIT1004]
MTQAHIQADCFHISIKCLPVLLGHFFIMAPDRIAFIAKLENFSSLLHANQNHMPLAITFRTFKNFHSHFTGYAVVIFRVN